MTGPARRKWFQIHLSTVLVVLGVGGAMWFPFVSVLQETTNDFQNKPYFGDSIAVAFGLLLVMLVAVGFVCERSIRRAEERKR